MGLGAQGVSRPLVSVVIPVRDRRQLLERCLVALEAQTYRPFEVIVVDDGSTDGSVEEALAHASALDLRVMRADGVGAVAARATGVRHARGEILAFTDSDCEPSPRWLDAGVDVLARGASVVQGRTEPIRPPRPFERTTIVRQEDGLYETCNVFYDRGAFERAGGFDVGAASRFGFRHGRDLRGLGFGEDTLLGWAVRRGGRAAFAPDAVVRHHVFAIDRGDAVRRAWAAGGFPFLVRDVPELAPILLRSGVALGTWRRVPLLVALLTGAAGRRDLAAVSAAMWSTLVVAHVLRDEPSLRRRARLLVLAFQVDAVSALALLVGSVRARRLVV